MVRTEIWQRLHPELADKEWFINKISTGSSYRKLAEQLGCSRQTVRKAAKYHGVERRPIAIINNEALKEALAKIK